MSHRPRASQERKLRVFLSASYDPWFNLATEEWIFREMDPEVQTLFLWRNSDTVVIGRNQNPWSECNLARMEQDGVKLARRTSGGGAVFHDLGNTCFTFLSPRRSYDRRVNNQLLLSSLSAFGIAAEVNGRNDLVINSEDGYRKFSGAAFRETRDRAFHHGTLLIESNLARLANYLTPNPKKLESKGRPSVRSRVINLNEIVPDLTHQRICEKLIEEFCRHYGADCEVELLDPARLESLEDLKNSFDHLSSWDWRFGHAPQFSHQMSEYFMWGSVELLAETEGSKVISARIFTDALESEFLECFSESFQSCTYNRSGIEAAAVQVARAFPEKIRELGEFVDWLKIQIEV